MLELIKTMMNSMVSSTPPMVLPQFNPEDQDADARAWRATVTLCMLKKLLSGSVLIVSVYMAVTSFIQENDLVFT